MVDKDLASALQLPWDCEDEDVSSAIIALLFSAVHDAKPRSSLSEIYQLLTNLCATSYLDPLNSIPLLLPCNDPAARDIISLIGECGPAKEVVMTVQEAAERLEHSLEREEEEKEEEPESTSPIDQLLILIDLYASAIPRMKLRRKTASETLKPLFEELERIIDLVSQKITRDEGRSILASVTRLAHAAGTWAEGMSATAPEDFAASKEILKDLLNHSLISCGHCIHGAIAQRVLEQSFSRLSQSSRAGSDWQGGEEVVSALFEAYVSLGYQPKDTKHPASPTDLVLSAYRPPTEVAPETLLSLFLPVVISSIQSNAFLDEALAVLIRALHAIRTDDSATNLSHEITLPLCGTLPSVASAHPDPIVRYQTFRVLSLLLASGNPQLRFQHLVEYTRDSEYPQMRVASVGLVKEALLQSFSLLPKDSVFLSPLFLRTFGPILFRPDPPDLLSSGLTLKDFQETHEPGRLVECLSLYYVLLQRDERNLTGIRDKDVLKSVEGNLLNPLRNSLDRWMSDPSVSQSHLRDITPIVSLKISLERVDAALAGLRST